MNLMVCVEGASFERIAYQSNGEAFAVKISFCSDQKTATWKTVDATMLVTDFETEDFHERNVDLWRQLQEERNKNAELRLKLQIKEAVGPVSSADSIDQAEAESPLGKQKLAKSQS